jgi:DNA polymerase-3 subunit delta'
VSWQRVCGHELLVKSFAEVVRRDRLGHAYLFVGPAGVGKRLFARELAKALLCENSAGKFDACDACPACTQVEAGTHPDLILASRPEDKVELPTDTIREVSEKLALKPARGGQKVAIVDDADDFNDNSANSFLKTLEEPPPRSLLIVLATDFERQLPTIVSRCQIVRFAPLPIPTVAELLTKQGVDSAKAERLARLSGGSLGQALGFADDSLWEFRREFAAELAKAKPDTVALSKRWMEFIEDAGKEAGAQRRRAAQVLRMLIELVNAGLTVSAGAAPHLIEPDDRSAITRLAERGTERLLQLLDRSLDADHQIDRKVQLVLIIEALTDTFA